MNHTYLDIYTYFAKPRTFSISILPAGSIPEPLGSLCQLDITFLQARAHLAASRNQEAGWKHMEAPSLIFEPYILIHIMASKDSGLCMDITYTISFVHILCTCTTIAYINIHMSTYKNYPDTVFPEDTQPPNHRCALRSFWNTT